MGLEILPFPSIWPKLAVTSAKAAMGANIKYKDSVFSALFSDPAVLRELYCALEGVSLPEDVPITINTLQDVLFMGMANDISFEIGGKQVVLIEHQSTVNPNMALRLLMYIARVYEKVVGDMNIYASRKVRVPRPEFFVLYNGAAAFPEEQELRLSESFAEAGPDGHPWEGGTALELTVRVVNINQGMNEGIAGKCRTLAEYSAFVGKVREYKKETGDLGEAIREAIKHCREHGILREYLERNATEVISMLMTEWNLDDALAVRYKEGREEGKEEGKEESREEIARNALAKGLPIDVIHDITGVDMEVIRNIQADKQ